MEFMVAGGEANTIDTSHKCFCRSAGLFFFLSFGMSGRFMAGTRQWWKAAVSGGGGCRVLFVKDNTQQQHTEMLRGAIDSTDGRISEIPRR